MLQYHNKDFSGFIFILFSSFDNTIVFLYTRLSKRMNILFTRCSSCLGLMVWFEHESEATVDAALGCPVIQIDVHLGMTESTATSVTGNLAENNEIIFTE